MPFVIDAQSPSIHDGDRTYYFCCASCLTYFEKHRQDVLRKRGLA